MVFRASTKLREKAASQMQPNEDERLRLPVVPIGALAKNTTMVFEGKPTTTAFLTYLL